MILLLLIKIIGLYRFQRLKPGLEEHYMGVGGTRLLETNMVLESKKLSVKLLRIRRF
ncbi:hypothetical protein V6Z11_A11G380400 [Gossypium hirsutum]